MSISVEQKLATLKSELTQIGETYNNAQKVLEQCKQKILQLQGGIEACEDILKPDEPAT